MKNIIFIFIVCFSQMVHAQDIHIDDIGKYKSAYDYIMADSIMENKKLYVSPSVADLGLIIFSEILKDYPDLIENVDSLVYSSRSKEFESTVLKKLYINLDPRSPNILFFSPVKENTLMASLHMNKISLSALDIQAVYAERAFLYLFIFDDKNSIKKVFMLEMIYN